MTSQFNGKVSVITVCLNSARTIADTIASFDRQTYSNKELVVVDGGSTDGTLDILKRMASPQMRVLSEPDDGLYDAMNKGLSLFTGDAVGILNSDDTFRDQFALQHIADALRDADVVYGDKIIVHDQVSKRPLRVWRAGTYRKGKFRLGWCPPHTTFYVRRAVVEQVGGFDCSYPIAADYDLMLRVLEKFDFRVRYIPHFLIDFAFGGQSTGSLRNIIYGSFECLRSRRVHLGPRLIDAAFFLKPLRKVLQFRV